MNFRKTLETKTYGRRESLVIDQVMLIQHCINMFRDIKSILRTKKYWFDTFDLNKVYESQEMNYVLYTATVLSNL